MTEVTIMSVTRLSSGVCVAGITEDGEWVRPTRPEPSGWRQLKFEDCKDANDNWIVKKGNVVMMNLIKAIPTGEHSEDWLVGSGKPKLVRKIPEDDYYEFCKTHQELSLSPLLKPEANRSLILIHPQKVTSFTFQVETSSKGKRTYVPRCGFVFKGQYYLRKPISDAEWRGYGRKYLKASTGPKASDIYTENGIKDLWLSIGRNIVGSNVYLLVIGVHLFPVREFKMDFERI